MRTAESVVITGADGFIGRSLVSELLNHGASVYTVMRENRIQAYPFRDHPLTHMVACDMDNISTLVQYISADIDLFYHLAWKGVSGADRLSPEVQLKNVQWTVDALQTAKQLGCKRFLSMGSIMEYEALAGTYAPDYRSCAGAVYAGAKVMAHIMCMRLAEELGIEVVWPILTNAYGPGERSARLVNTTIRKCLREEPPQFTSGTQNYDFIYIDDAARALRLVGERGHPFHEYLIGSSHARPLKEFLLEMRASIAPNVDFRFGGVPFAGIDLPLERFDCSRTEVDTGFKAEVSFAEGCKRTADWWRQQV